MPKIKNKEIYHNLPEFTDSDKEAVRKTIDNFIQSPNDLNTRKFQELFDLKNIKFSPSFKEFSFQTITNITQTNISDKIASYYLNSEYARYITEYLSSPAIPFVDEYNYHDVSGENPWFKKHANTTILSQIIHTAVCFENLLKTQKSLERIKDKQNSKYSQLFFHEVLGHSLINFNKTLKNYVDSDYQVFDYNPAQNIFILTHTNIKNYEEAIVLLIEERKNLIENFCKKAIKYYSDIYPIEDVGEKLEVFLSDFQKYRKDIKAENLNEEEEIKKIVAYVSKFRDSIEPLNHISNIELYYCLWIDELKQEPIEYRGEAIIEFTKQSTYYFNDTRTFFLNFSTNDGIDFLLLPNEEERNILDIKNRLLRASEGMLLGSIINTIVCHTTANLVDKEKKELEKFLNPTQNSMQTKVKSKQKI